MVLQGLGLREQFAIRPQGQVVPFPKFGMLVQHPPIAAPLTLDVSNQPADVLALSSQKQPKQVRVVLASSTDLGARIQALTEQLAKNLTVSNPAPDALSQLVAKVSNAMADALNPKKPVDALGNMYARYDAQTGNKKGAVALKAIANAFKQQLDSLPKEAESIHVELPEHLPKDVTHDDVVRELTELAILHQYNYNFQHQENQPGSKLATLTFTLNGSAQTIDLQALREGQTLGEAINFARHFVDAPANFKTTRYMSQQAQKLASGTLSVTTREGGFLEGGNPYNPKRMGLFLSVAQGNQPGSERATRLVEMVYTPKDGKYDKTILLVGKGIVFDTGGNNLKPSEYIHKMEGDMAGAAAVMATMKALDQLQIPGVRVVGLAPLTENRLGSSATLPNDIYTSRQGKTVQIENTDAEGRLILADAMHYGQEKYQPDVIADIATLTGGKVRGVGAQNAVAVSGNNPALMKAVQGIESDLQRTVEVLKLTDAHHRWVTRGGQGKADVSNSVSLEDAKEFGVIPKDNLDTRLPMLQHSAQGAAFLREFLADPNTPWVHYDMAGAEFDKKDPKRGNTEWATGFGVKDLYYLVKNIAEGSVTPDRRKTQVVSGRKQASTPKS